MTARKRLVVVGNGMAGARFVEHLVRRGGSRRFEIVVFGDEPHGNYNRILLSGVLAGSHRPSDIMINPLSWYESNGVRLHSGVRVERIDPSTRRIAASGGMVEHYDSLVLATGSRPLLPAIDGLREPALPHGVFVFRTLDDCERIAGRAREAKRAAVIGGGLLGLEAARGLLNFGLDVHVVHLMPHIMDVQLDATGGGVLRRHLEAIGLQVWASKKTTALLSSNERVSGLRFSDGSALECEMVVVAAGIRPNIELARQAGLMCRRGIVVGDDLGCYTTGERLRPCRGPQRGSRAGVACRAEDEQLRGEVLAKGRAGGGAPAPVHDVYAIGECAEHRGQVHGLVAPCWEQAELLADRLTGHNPLAQYVGSRAYTKLKVAGIDLAVMGLKEPVEDDDEVVSYAEPTRGIYKKLIVRANRLAGAIVIGDGAIVPSLVQAFTESTVLPPDRAEALFPSAGLSAATPAAPDQIADTAQICDCNAVSKGQIIEAVLGGARSLQAVRECTRASTGCGSCAPEVQKIIELACRGLDQPELLRSSERVPDSTPDLNVGPAPPSAGPGFTSCVSSNKIERIKAEKDGLDILADVPALAAGGWEAIADDDRERLKWGGVFFRRQTPGRFMMRLRISNGLTNADQIRAIADVGDEFGTGSVDITTRQQIQVRGFAIERLPEIWSRLERVGLCSLQTGMDNIRNVIGCPVAGLTPRELFDASPVVHEFTRLFLMNKAFTNLPRKFNVGISGCTEHCTHAESQDIALTPAIKDNACGFNVSVGGKMGSGGCRMATPLDIFVEPDRAAALCAEIALIFRDHGSRATRTKARLAFLVESWGARRFRDEVEKRTGRPLAPAGRDARVARSSDHLGIVRQKQTGLSYVGLAVAVGRTTAAQLRDVAGVASTYGSGEVRLTTGQNIIVPNVPEANLPALVKHPVLDALPYDPPGAIRGLVACTGIDYCHFALIETKEAALRAARHLAEKLPHGRRFSMHWSGCPAGCGNHAVADIGLVGKNIRVGNDLIEAVDVFVGGKAGLQPKAGVKVLEDVPCDDLPHVLERIIPFLAGPHPRTGTPPMTHSHGARAFPEPDVSEGQQRIGAPKLQDEATEQRRTHAQA